MRVKTNALFVGKMADKLRKELEELLAGGMDRRKAIKKIRLRTHPDKGGSREEWDALNNIVERDDDDVDADEPDDTELSQMRKAWREEHAVAMTEIHAIRNGANP